MVGCSAWVRFSPDGAGGGLIPAAPLNIPTQTPTPTYPPQAHPVHDRPNQLLQLPKFCNQIIIYLHTEKRKKISESPPHSANLVMEKGDLAHTISVTKCQHLHPIPMHTQCTHLYTYSRSVTILFDLAATLPQPSMQLCNNLHLFKMFFSIHFE